MELAGADGEYVPLLGENKRLAGEGDVWLSTVLASLAGVDNGWVDAGLGCFSGVKNPLPAAEGGWGATKVSVNVKLWNLRKRLLSLLFYSIW